MTKCSKCGSRAGLIRHGERWSNLHGYIIYPNESLCNKCEKERIAILEFTHYTSITLRPDEQREFEKRKK